MRGKRDDRGHRVRAERIIPARAGQTGSSPAGPHGRPGSSPRVRGKQVAVDLFLAEERIIPARAGQTPPLITMVETSPDHPRACGANSLHARLVAYEPGSSPRVRGKRRESQRMIQRTRIIPARAGQTVRFYAKTLERWTLNNWIRTVAPIFVLLFLLPVIGQNAYIERHYSNQSFSWFSKLHYASAFDLSLVA